MEKIYEIISPGKTIISVDDTGITISRKGILNAINHGLKGDKKIFYNNISAVQLKKPGLTNGYIQFTIVGGNESKGGLFSATKDENTVMFAHEYWGDMQELKNHIEYKLNEPASTSNTNHHPSSPIQQVKELKELLDIGAITQEEFDKKKKDLLGL